MVIFPHYLWWGSCDYYISGVLSTGAPSKSHGNSPVWYEYEGRFHILFNVVNMPNHWWSHYRKEHRGTSSGDHEYNHQIWRCKSNHQWSTETIKTHTCNLLTCDLQCVGNKVICLWMYFIICHIWLAIDCLLTTLLSWHKHYLQGSLLLNQPLFAILNLDTESSCF